MRARVAPWARWRTASGVRRLVEQPRELDEPGRRALGERGLHRLGLGAAGELAERLEHGHVRLAGAAVADALADAGHGAAGRGRLGEERVDQRALPGAGLAVEEHAGAAAARRRGQRAAQPAELVLAADGGRARGGHRHRRRGLVVGGQVRVLLEDAALERAHRLAGLQAQLAQARGELAIGRERLDLPAAARTGPASACG